MADEKAKLELLLTKVTNPALEEEDWEAIVAFCDQVNHELEGPQFAIRLLAHKIQSPTEREALYALSTLEACVKNCGRAFHQEIGKFRFLNEVIKVVSPKYLGGRTTEKVKKRCIELLYSWHKGLPHEAKIGDAYKMLREQGIVKQDPTYMDKTFDPFPPPKPRKADFEDDEKSRAFRTLRPVYNQTLSRLLKSKNPEDLQAANRLIKNMVKEDAEKSEKRSRRINELEAINNQVKLLLEMVNYFGVESSAADKDVMRELYEALEKQRPKLFRLASDTDENEADAINEILKVNDAVTRAMTMYMSRVQGVGEEDGVAHGTTRDTTLLDLGFEYAPPCQTQVQSVLASGASALLQNNFQNLGLDDASGSSSLHELSDLFGSQAIGAPGAASVIPQDLRMGGTGIQVPLTGISSYTLQQSGSAVTRQSTVQQQEDHFITKDFSPFTIFPGTSFTSNTSAAQCRVSLTTTANVSPMADLDPLGKAYLEKKYSKDLISSATGTPAKLSLNQMGASNKADMPTSLSLTSLSQRPMPLFDPGCVPTTIPIISSPSIVSVPNSSRNNAAETSGGHLDDPVFSAMVSARPGPVSSTVELLPLTDMFVPLESITPAEDLPPVTVYDKNGLKSMIHFSTNQPRADVLVMVLSSISTNTKSITNFLFQAAVPKIMKVKLQPPSATDLPAYNPLHPPAAITQVLLIANPRKERVRLKFRISYSISGNQTTDVGEAEDFPIQ
ncbi:ADP-ribosylation factor-binding protein GGA1-like isoform X2 [Pomacea canaliculata]|uniref:ADP-ribosylation factor-binding protein GGA1-like isoform X2 n=1 Tax=Pomacea canaliculata TaxID=400727 RepID=UPI000D735804|nr:ADP-ribosylation factor-binding protein GGA1-like isoform X2 [Pomacea canaliculata]